MTGGDAAAALPTGSWTFTTELVDQRPVGDLDVIPPGDLEYLASKPAGCTADIECAADKCTILSLEGAQKPCPLRQNGTKWRFDGTCTEVGTRCLPRTPVPANSRVVEAAMTPEGLVATRLAGVVEVARFSWGPLRRQAVGSRPTACGRGGDSGSCHLDHATRDDSHDSASQPIGASRHGSRGDLLMRG